MAEHRTFPCNDHNCRTGWSHEVEMTKNESESYDKNVKFVDGEPVRESLEDWLYHYPELDNKYTSCPDCGSN